MAEKSSYYSDEEIANNEKRKRDIEELRKEIGEPDAATRADNLHKFSRHRSSFGSGGDTVPRKSLFEKFREMAEEEEKK
jgi:hypothetical protein